MRWCWVNCQCRGVLVISIRVGQGPTALAEGAGGGCLDIYFLSSIFSLFFLPVLKTARYRLKSVSKGRSTQNSQPTNHVSIHQECKEASIISIHDNIYRKLRKVYSKLHTWTNAKQLHADSVPRQTLFGIFFLLKTAYDRRYQQ